MKAAWAMACGHFSTEGSKGSEAQDGMRNGVLQNCRVFTSLPPLPSVQTLIRSTHNVLFDL
jgi:hypothetical protein